MKVVIRLNDNPEKEAISGEPSEKAVLRINAFKAEHKALLDRADKQMQALEDDSKKITGALEASESYPAEQMPALLSVMYRHHLALKLTAGTLDSLLEEEDEEVRMLADFMDDCVLVLYDSEMFLVEANEDFTSIVLGNLADEMHDRDDDDDENDEEDDFDDEEPSDEELVCVFETDDPTLPGRLVASPKAQKALKELSEAIAECKVSFDC